MSISSSNSPTESQEYLGNNMNGSEKSTVETDSVSSELQDNEQGQMALTKIAEISKLLSSGTERKEMAKEVIGTECSWEKFLLPAPMSVAILGQLMALGTTIDFSLLENSPIGGFQYVKHPGSFRACLVQLSMEGANAFSASHTNMDKIKLFAMQFQMVMRDIVPLLLGKTDKGSKPLIAEYLGDLEKYTTKCQEISLETCDKFKSLMNLLNEIQLSSTAAKGLHERETKKIKERKQILERNQELYEKKLSDIEEHKQKLTEQLALAKADLDKTLEEIPGPWQSVAIATWDNVIGTASAVGTVLSLSQLSNPVGMTVAVAYAAYSSLKYISATEKNNKGKKNEAIHFTLNEATKMSSAAKCLFEIVKRFKDTTTTDNETELSEKVKKEVKSVNDIFNYVIKKLEPSEGTTVHQITKSAVETCEKGVSLCNEILKYNGRLSTKMEDTLKTIMDDAASLELQSSILLTPGAMYDSGFKVDDTKSRDNCMVQQASEGVYKKVEMRKHELNELRQKQKDDQKKAEELQNAQAEIFEELVKVDIKEIDFNKIMKMLSESVEAFGQLHEQWQLLSLLFLNIAQRIKISLQESSNHFARHIKYSGSELTVDSSQIILQLAATANATAHSIQIIAETYTDISGKYLVGPTAGLAQMIGLDPVKDEKKIEEKRKKLTDALGNAQDEIKQLAGKSRAKQLKAIDDQFERIDALGKELPALPVENRLTIQTNVRKSIQTLQSHLNVDDFI